MEKLNKRAFRFDVLLNARKVGSEERLYCTVQAVYISLQDMCKKEGENAERGEEKPRTPKTEGLLQHLRAQSDTRGD